MWMCVWPVATFNLVIFYKALPATTHAWLLHNNNKGNISIQRHYFSKTQLFVLVCVHFNVMTKKKKEMLSLRNFCRVWLAFLWAVKVRLLLCCTFTCSASTWQANWLGRMIIRDQALLFLISRPSSARAGRMTYFQRVCRTILTLQFTSKQGFPCMRSFDSTVLNTRHWLLNSKCFQEIL